MMAMWGLSCHRASCVYCFVLSLNIHVFLWSRQQNQDRKHRTYVYVLTVTETLEAWEDSVNIGTVSFPSLSLDCLHMHLQLQLCLCLLWSAAVSSLTKYCIFLFTWSQLCCMETTWAVGYAATTGAYKSSTTYLSSSTLELSLVQTSVKRSLLHLLFICCEFWKSLCHACCVFVYAFTFVVIYVIFSCACISVSGPQDSISTFTLLLLIFLTR